VEHALHMLLLHVTHPGLQEDAETDGRDKGACMSHSIRTQYNNTFIASAIQCYNSRWG